MADNAADRVPIQMKLGYGIGDFACNIMLQTVTLYLFYFFTDVFLIGAAAAGAIFLIAKLWNAFLDPLVGFCCDHTRSRWGKKRPYILFGALPLGISFIALFAQPDLPERARFVYGLCCYFLFCTAFAFVCIPYGSLTAAMTLDSEERSSVTGFRIAFAMVGSLLAAGITKPLATLFGSEVQGFRMMGLIFGTTAAAILLVTFASVRERVSSTIDKHSLRENFTVVLENRPFQYLLIAYVLYSVAIFTMATTVNYYFKYYLNAEPWIPFAFLAIFGTALVAIPLWIFLANARSKKFAFNSGMVLLVGALMVIFLARPAHPHTIFPCLIIAGAGVSTTFIFPWTMLPDTVEYSQWKTGMRREGILYGFFLFGIELAAALAPFLIGLTLEAIGFQARAVQSARTLEGIRVMTTIVPCAFIVIGIAVLSFYPIDTELHRKILEEIRAGEKKQHSD